MKRVAYILVLGLLGCNVTSKLSDNSWSTMSPADRAAALDDIARKCRVERSTFKADGDELHVNSNPSEDYEDLDCAMRRLSDIGVTKMGFIGNEAYVEEKK